MEKNEAISLSESKTGLKNVMVAAGWDLVEFDGKEPADIDLSCFLLDITDKTRQDSDFIFFNNTENENGAVKHKGDNRTGAGEGDDEIIFLDLSQIDYEVATIVFVVSIYEAEKKGQDFSDVSNAYIRVLDEDGREELLRFDLAEGFAGETAVKIAALERAGNDWYFKAIGTPIKGGLGEIAKKYGMLIAP